MSHSLLLQLAKDSVREVFEARNIIDRSQLLSRYPVLKEPVASFVTLWLEGQVRGSSGTLFAQRTLLEDIIYNAKIAAFEDPSTTPMTTSEYLHCELELSLLTPPMPLQYHSMEALYAQIHEGSDALALKSGNQLAVLLPFQWQEFSDTPSFVTALMEQIESPQLEKLEFYRFEVESVKSKPIIKENSV